MNERGPKEMQLKVIHQGEQPPCLTRVIQCRGCFGWKPMIKAAKEIPLWKKYPFRCACTGLTMRYVSEEDSE